MLEQGEKEMTFVMERAVFTTLCMVYDQEGRVLVQERRGTQWDGLAFPGGHVEPGESFVQAAAREVQEETGVKELSLGDLICITDHCYRRNGIWHLKHTWWFDMLYTAPTDLIPQKEEDISKAAWVAKSSLPSFLDKTYPSILEVFKEKFGQ